MRTLDPRVERTRRVVLAAAVDELAAAGYGGFTVDGVATRSGVARSTIYRHWPDKLALISEAFEVLNVQPPEPGAADMAPRQRIESLIGHLAEAFRDSPLSGCVPALIDGAERDPGLRRFHHGYSARRRSALVRAIALGIEAGELRDDLDAELAAAALAGAVLYLRTMTPEPLDPARARALVDTVLGTPT
jgi:AcrR family transcriptional regulator